MKKTLIALAALAATGAFAQSVTLSGTVDATMRATSTSTATTTSNNSKLGKDGSGTSNLTISGDEDLGGGLKAMFLYEMDFDPSVTGANRNGTTTTSTTGAIGPVQGGQSYVGVSGGFGTVKLGVPNAPTLTVQGARTPFGTKDGGRAGVYAGLMGTSVTRLDNSINYATPTMAGFSANLSYTPGQSDAALATDSEGGTISDIGVFYANGPLAGGVSRYARSVYKAVDAGQQTSWYVSYDFKVVKATLGGHSQAVYDAANAKTESSGVSLGLVMPLSAKMDLQYAYQRLNDTSANDRDSQANIIGVNYAMSKRTSVYARYGYQTTENPTGSATQVEKGNTTLVGLRHNF